MFTCLPKPPFYAVGGKTPHFGPRVAQTPVFASILGLQSSYDTFQRLRRKPLRCAPERTTGRNQAPRQQQLPIAPLGQALFREELSPVATRLFELRAAAPADSPLRPASADQARLLQRLRVA